MPRLRITKIEIQGFRSFGKSLQTLTFPSQLAVVWGRNSHGKTNLAEAFEFLLTGRIVRRELLASSQDEFADALRNAHLPRGLPVFVQAEIVALDGNTHTVKRSLISDYGKKEDCRSALEIDGRASSERDLLSLGFVLSQPPLRAPVLTQHTLGYLFSVGPQDRSAYFKAVLEVTDLEAFRKTVAALESDLKTPSDPTLTRLIAAEAIPEARPSLAQLRAKIPTSVETANALAAAVAAVISASGEASPTAVGDGVAKLEEILGRKRSAAFPVDEFGKRPFTAWAPPGADVFVSLRTYVTERAKVDEATQRLIALFNEALALPAVTNATTAIDCPLCATEDALTPARIAFIRARLEDTVAFRKSANAAKVALAEITSIVQSAQKAIEVALPRFLAHRSELRRKRAFRMDRIRKLMGSEGDALIAHWLVEVRRIAQARTAVWRIADPLLAEVKRYTENLGSLTDVTALSEDVAALDKVVGTFSSRLSDYLMGEKPVADKIKAVVDASSRTTGWQDLIDLAKAPGSLRAALVEKAVHEEIQMELAQALKQIDKGNEAVLNSKFQDLSASTEIWWNLLRPDDMSFFAAVKPRAGTRRTIDFKAGLASKSDRSDLKLRDVIAVFSQSQLHCLGLALFIARSIHEGATFLVLDDPILSSDEDYRPFFNTTVIEKLLDNEIQLIMLTQDQSSRRDLEQRYLHKKVAIFQLSLTDPSDGTAVRNIYDDLAARFVKIGVLVRSGHPDLLKLAGESLRDAAERFCKEMLVKELQAKGDAAALISDYDNKNLGWLVPKVEPLLLKDPSHAGKLRAFPAALNPAKHDDDTPSQGALKVALGDLTFLKKQYLN